MRTRPGTTITSRTLRGGIAALALALAGAGATGLTVAQAAPADDTAAVSAPVTHDVSAASAEAAKQFWTPERLASATPLDRTVDGAELAAATRKAERQLRQAQASGSGAEVSVPAQRPTATLSTQAQQENPIGHIGKVFFTGTEGGTFVCSGNSIAAGNQSTVVTAGHCVNDGKGRFVSNWVFIPAYDNNNRPFGTFGARSLITTPEWNASGDFGGDVGFAVVDQVDGQTLSARVGGSGANFNGERYPSVTAYGYPAGAPFNGETLQSCQGGSYGASERTQGIRCDMNGGASGGPWFQGSGPDGQQVSVNSYKLVGDDSQMFGPYWGQSILDAYGQAANS